MSTGKATASSALTFSDGTKSSMSGPGVGAGVGRGGSGRGGRRLGRGLVPGGREGREAEKAQEQGSDEALHLSTSHSAIRATRKPRSGLHGAL